MKKTIICIIGLSILFTSAAGCGKGPDKKSKDDAIPVKVMRVTAKDVNKTLDYVGNIKGQDEAIVYPKISGKVIEKVKEEGNAVVKGEPIAYIDRDEVGLKFEKAPVESPLDGVVGRIYVDIGSTVNTQTPIALVTDTKKMEIDLDIPERYLPKVAVGQDAQVTVDSYPDEVFLGRVSSLSPVVDLATRTAPIEIVIDNSSGLLQSGMFAKVALILQRNAGVAVILKEAVIGRGDDTYVYVINDNVANLKKVKLGVRHGAYYEVREGLKEGDRVVIMGQQKLRDSVPVAAEE